MRYTRKLYLCQTLQIRTFTPVNDTHDVRVLSSLNPILLSMYNMQYTQDG